MNLLALSQNKPRFSTIDKDTWGMILGKMGKLPGKLAPEIVALAKEKGMEFYTGNPQDEYPDELPKFRQMMKDEGWDCGQDDEELFELAMHERQYRDYKSGIAKERFNKELEELKAQRFKGYFAIEYEVCGYVQTYYGNEEVIPAVDGRIVAVTAPQGKDVVKGEIVAFVE